MSKLNNWFLRYHPWENINITEIKPYDYSSNNYNYSLELDTDFHSGHGQSVNNYKYTANTILQIFFQGISYGKGVGDGASNLNGTIQNNNSKFNIVEYENGLGYSIYSGINEYDYSIYSGIVIRDYTV